MREPVKAEKIKAYIRALARDLGEALGSGAFLSSLRRTKNGGFGIEDAVSLEDVLEMLS